MVIHEAFSAVFSHPIHARLQTVKLPIWICTIQDVRRQHVDHGGRVFGEVHEVARLASSMTDSRRTDSVLDDFDTCLHHAVLPLSIGRRGAMHRSVPLTESVKFTLELRPTVSEEGRDGRRVVPIFEAMPV